MSGFTEVFNSTGPNWTCQLDGLGNYISPQASQFIGQQSWVNELEVSEFGELVNHTNKWFGFNAPWMHCTTV